MAELTCTIKEFHKFIGPRIRNQIKVKTKPRKKILNGICQDCKEQRELHAAHPNDNSRTAIIEKVLSKYIVDGKVIISNLQEVENEILAAHKDILFDFVCQGCHIERHKVSAESQKL